MESATNIAEYILQAPVFHPILPYITTIFGSLVPGRMVVVEGMILMNAERFQVDFQTGCSLSPRADIAFHFNPRFRPHSHVICNSLRNGRWMEESKFVNQRLKRGDPFLLLFLFEQEHVKVSVNGLHYLQYHLSVPLVRINTLGVSGDIIVKTIAFLAGSPFDDSRTGYPLAPHLHLKDPHLAVPLTCPFSQTLRPGDDVIMRGLVHQDPKEFNVILRKGPSQVILSLNVCFSNKNVVWKSIVSQGKESGEKVPFYFPFHPLRYFELLFRFEKDHLKWAVNGAPLGQRWLPLLSTEPITELTVEGDITLYSILC
ncbi:galectin-12 [Sphaerodactylus townsendi]|uniref:galectin-12 n=1 Tax=Sphaerodactylus townsendi TaxID=933632 RepID=UPI0020264BC3|nr:galectin-12 [Sphaerodactylus townsendi]XP_048368917.1 galectin-12 [Sphaerodactylus townsendi]